MKVNSFNYMGVLLCSFISISSLSLNPVYFLGLLLILIGFFQIDLHRIDKVFLSYLLYFLLTFLCFYVGYYFFLGYAGEGVWLSSLLYLYSILIGAQVIIFGNKISFERRRFVYKNIFNFLIIFMFADFISRLSNADFGSTDFYDYKHGIFFFDSNFTGLVIALFLMFSLFLKQRNVYDIGFLRFILLFLLLIFTFSRAAIFAFLLSYILLKYARRFMLLFSILFLSISGFVFYKMVNGYLSGESFVDIDGSFNSKFYIISLALHNYSSMPDMNKLLGIGMANFSYYSNGIFAHNMLVTLVYEFGVVGSCLFFVFLWHMYLKIGKDVLYLYLPLAIGGFSLFSAYMPFFFILLSCLYLENKKGEL